MEAWGSTELALKVIPCVEIRGMGSYTYRSSGWGFEPEVVLFLIDTFEAQNTSVRAEQLIYLVSSP